MMLHGISDVSFEYLHEYDTTRAEKQELFWREA